MHHLRLIQFTAYRATGSYQPDRGIFRHLEACTVCPIPSSLICPLLPSGIYACFFYFSDHWAPASLKLIESETCLPEETLTLSIKEISDFTLSIRSKDRAHVFNTDTCGAHKRNLIPKFLGYFIWASISTECTNLASISFLWWKEANKQTKTPFLFSPHLYIFFLGRNLKKPLSHMMFCQFHCIINFLRFA